MRYPIVGLGTWSLTEHGKSSGQYEYEVHSVTYMSPCIFEQYIAMRLLLSTLRLSHTWEPIQSTLHSCNNFFNHLSPLLPLNQFPVL